MKTTWAKREYIKCGDYRAALNQLYASAESRYADELKKAGFLQRMILRYRIARDFRAELRREVEL